jgi:hypothetical protein
MDWDRKARTGGWTTLLLYGLHQRAPYATLMAMSPSLPLSPSSEASG